MVALAADLRLKIARRDMKIGELERKLSNRNRLLEKTGAWLDNTGSTFADTARFLKRELEEDRERDERAAAAMKRKKTEQSA